MIHYHGTPITPNAVLQTLAGACFCVSFARPEQVTRVHEIGQSVMLDNGAFSFWRLNRKADWTRYYEWVEEWLAHPTTWAVIPDVIDGTEEQNDQLISEWEARQIPRGAPVWHMHEPLDRLRRLCADFERVCIGSSGTYATLRTNAWHRRMEEAMDAVCRGRVPWLHMLRGMALSGGPYPFASVDSSDIARNHHRKQKTAADMRARWDAMQCPARWNGATQMVLSV